MAMQQGWQQAVQVLPDAPQLMQQLPPPQRLQPQVHASRLVYMAPHAMQPPPPAPPAAAVYAHSYMPPGAPLAYMSPPQEQGQVLYRPATGQMGPGMHPAMLYDMQHMLAPPAHQALGDGGQHYGGGRGRNSGGGRGRHGGGGGGGGRHPQGRGRS